MSISIWRQYASNHSADFTVVGAFPSEADAASAVAELRAILAEIYAARAQLIEDALRQEVERRAQTHPHLMTDAFVAAAAAGRWDEALGVDAAAVRTTAQQALWRDPPVTEAEQALAALYEVEWPNRGIDWLPLTLAEAEAQIRQVGSLLIIEPSGNTWSGHRPFSGLVRRLGGQVALTTEDGPDTEEVVVAACVAPDEAIARRLTAELPAHLHDLDRSVWRMDIEVERRGRALTCRLSMLSDVPKILPRLVTALTKANCTGMTYSLESRGDWRWVLGSPQARTLKPRELDAAVALILELNRQPEQHCLDCPDEADALRAALTAPDTQVVVAAVDRRDTLLGALVLMGVGTVRRVWGPYVVGRPWQSLAQQLIRRVPHGVRFASVYGPENWRCPQLLAEMGRMTPDGGMSHLEEYPASDDEPAW